MDRLGRGLALATILLAAGCQPTESTANPTRPEDRSPIVVQVDLDGSIRLDCETHRSEAALERLSRLQADSDGRWIILDASGMDDGGFLLDDPSHLIALMDLYAGLLKHSDRAAVRPMPSLYTPKTIKELGIELPTPAQARQPAPVDAPLAIAIESDGTFRIDGKEVDAQGLAKAIEEAGKRDPKPRVQLWVDRRTGFTQVYSVTDQLMRHGLTNWSMRAQPE